MKRTLALLPALAVAVGFASVVAGVVLALGVAWALIVAGVALVSAGLLVDVQ